MKNSKKEGDKRRWPRDWEELAPEIIAGITHGGDCYSVDHYKELLREWPPITSKKISTIIEIITEELYLSPTTGYLPTYISKDKIQKAGILIDDLKKIITLLWQDPSYIVLPGLNFDTLFKENGEYCELMFPVDQPLAKNFFNFRTAINDIIKEEDELNDETKDKNDNFLISKNNQGEYLYNGQKIEMNTTTIYYKIFDILYSHHDQNGFLSYENIEKYLRKCDEQSIEDEVVRDKRIKNAISNKQQGLFRFAKVGKDKLKNKTPKGDELIKVVWGKGLKLNNPRI